MTLFKSPRFVVWPLALPAIVLLSVAVSCRKDPGWTKVEWGGYKSADGTFLDISEVRRFRSTFRSDARERLTRFLALRRAPGDLFEAPSGCLAVSKEGDTFEVRAALFGPRPGWLVMEAKGDWVARLRSFPDARIPVLLDSLKQVSWSPPSANESIHIQAIGSWTLPTGWFSQGAKFGAEPGDDLGALSSRAGVGATLRDHGPITGSVLATQLQYANLRKIGHIGKIETLERITSPHDPAYLVRSDTGVLILAPMGHDKQSSDQVLGLARDIQGIIDAAKAKRDAVSGKKK